MQDKQLTRLKGYISTGFPCEKKNLLTDLHEFWPHKKMLSIKSGLITCGNRIIVSKEMRTEMLQYVHKGHQGKERCLLRARNTVFWPKMTYNVQQLIEKCIICQEHGKSQPIIGTTQELPPFPWHTLATDMSYWKRMDFLIVADVFLKILPSEEIAKFYICNHLCRTIHDCNRTNRTCPRLSEVIMVCATIPRSSSNFCNDTTSHTKPAAQIIPDLMGFFERMVGVAKKLMDKARKKGNPWISGLYD